MAKGASEDRLAHFVDLLEADTGVPRDCSPAVMDDRVALRKKKKQKKKSNRGRLMST